MLKMFNLTIDVPAIVLLILLAAGLGVMWASQRRPDFDFGNMLKDESGKESAMRFAVFVCLAISSWHLIYLTIHVITEKGSLDTLFNFYALYLAVWSSAKIVEKVIDLLLAKFGGPK